KTIHHGLLYYLPNTEGRTRPSTAHQKRWMAIAGVTDDCVLWPFGTIQTPRMAPALSLQLYSAAGAKPVSQLFGADWFTSVPSAWRPVTLVLPHWSRSTSKASTHSLVRLYSAPKITLVFAPGFAWPWKPASVPYTLRPETPVRSGKSCRILIRARSSRPLFRRKYSCALMPISGAKEPEPCPSFSARK